jgi:hypothetical protein
MEGGFFPGNPGGVSVTLPSTESLNLANAQTFTGKAVQGYTLFYSLTSQWLKWYF